MMYLRMQCEALALAQLLQHDPPLATTWVRLTPVDGKKFYRDYQGNIKNQLREWGLDEAYDRASEQALHVRILAIGRSLSISSHQEGDRVVSQIGVTGQEVNLSHPEWFLVDVLYLLRMQVRIIEYIQSAILKASDPDLAQRVSRSRIEIDRLVGKARRQYGLQRADTGVTQTNEESESG